MVLASTPPTNPTRCAKEKTTYTQVSLDNPLNLTMIMTTTTTMVAEVTGTSIISIIPPQVNPNKQLSLITTTITTTTAIPVEDMGTAIMVMQAMVPSKGTLPDPTMTMTTTIMVMLVQDTDTAVQTATRTQRLTESTSMPTKRNLRITHMQLSGESGTFSSLGQVSQNEIFFFR